MSNGRPGLLLMWHGDFPDDFLSSERHMALYQKCLRSLGLLHDQACYSEPSFDDEYARMGLFIAYHLLSRMKPDHLELSYLSLRSPGVRQAIYRTASRGSQRIICVGAAGLMMPGHGAVESLPAELKKVMKDNPALDLFVSQPGLEAGDIAALVRQSLEFAFNGLEGRGKMPGRSFRSLEGTGVVLVCSHDHMPAHVDLGALEQLTSGSSMLSDMSKEAFASGGRCDATELIRSVASTLNIGGFHAVESGFMDFALPDIEEAGRRLLDAGCSHIVAAGMPSLLHRHPYSIGGPSDSAERLQKALPDTNIIYVKPDPAPISPYIADILMSKVLDIEQSGISLKELLRKR